MTDLGRRGLVTTAGGDRTVGEPSSDCESPTQARGNQRAIEGAAFPPRTGYAILAHVRPSGSQKATKIFGSKIQAFEGQPIVQNIYDAMKSTSPLQPILLEIPLGL